MSTSVWNSNREKAVLIVAETAYSLVLKAVLDYADPEIKARVMLVAEGVIDALSESGMLPQWAAV